MFINASKILQLLLLANLYYLAPARIPYGNCSALFGITMNLKCKGRVSEYLHKRYQDRYVHEDVPYAIYSPSQLMLFVFVTMYYSPILNCGNLTIVDENNFLCNSNPVKLTYSMMFCFEYPSHYLAELRDNCLKSSNPGFYAINHSAIHYTNIPCMAKAGSFKWWLLIVSTVVRHLF